jgi:hypothetical protein
MLTHQCKDVLNFEMYVARYLGKMRALPVDMWEDAESFTGPRVVVPDPAPDILAIQQKFADVIAPHLQPDGVVFQTIQSSFAVEHIMIFSMMRCLSCFFALLNRVPRIIAEYNDQHVDFPMTPDQVERFSSKRLVFSILWAIVGDARVRFVCFAVLLPVFMSYALLPVLIVEHGDDSLPRAGFSTPEGVRHGTRRLQHPAAARVRGRRD